MEEAETSSPNTRLKFLCSYGGRILPRPSDGHLRYAGGETRVLTVPRSITFTELKEKMGTMFSSDLVVKYQLLQEDLDALVSVKNDEDLGYMIDEYDRFACRLRSPTAASAPLFRLFLFPSPGAADPDPPMHHQLYTISSAGTSPTSADCFFQAAASQTNGGGGDSGGGGMGMHRVRSTPNLGSGIGNGGSQASSPRAYKKPGTALGYSGASGLKMGGGCGGGGVRQEVGYGCGCGCGCVCSAQQLVRKYVCSPPVVVEGSPPRRGNQRCPPLAAPILRKVVWE